jgi:G3E family GTPase
MVHTDTQADRRPKVICLSGFLGAGKTTLLNHLLKTKGNRRIALIVNDLGEINIDRDLIQTAHDGPLPPLVELTDGCVCCTLQDDLAEEIARISAEYQPEWILVESTGVAEPVSFARIFLIPNEFGRSVSDFAELRSLVTVVDLPRLDQFWDAVGGSQSTAGEEKKKTPWTLMAEQIECADLLILSKEDLCLTLAPERIDSLKAMVRTLNPRAAQLSAPNGKVDWATFERLPPFDQRETLQGAGWLQALAELVDAEEEDAHCEHDHTGDDLCDHCGHDHDHDHPSHLHDTHAHNPYGLETYLYRSRKPLDPLSLGRWLAKPPSGVLRAKGIVWVEGRNHLMGFLSIAGPVGTCEFAGPWWIVRQEQGFMGNQPLPPALEKIWDPELGDRRNELVFIGIDLKKQDIEKQLQAMER